MTDREFQLIDRCVCVCENCGNAMALYKELRTGKYIVECDVCPNFRYVEVEVPDDRSKESR